MSPLRVTSAAPLSRCTRVNCGDISGRTAGRSRGPHSEVEPGATPLSALRSAVGRSRFTVLENKHDHARRLTPSTGDVVNVLVGVKGSRASLGGCAALDPACARWLLATIDVVADRCSSSLRTVPQTATFKSRSFSSPRTNCNIWLQQPSLYSARSERQGGSTRLIATAAASGPLVSRSRARWPAGLEDRSLTGVARPRQRLSARSRQRPELRGQLRVIALTREWSE